LISIKRPPAAAITIELAGASENFLETTREPIPAGSQICRKHFHAAARATGIDGCRPTSKN
jgi:hypothetical protein